VVTKANIAAIYYVDLMKNWNFIDEGLLGKSLLSVFILCVHKLLLQ